MADSVDGGIFNVAVGISSSMRVWIIRLAALPSQNCGGGGVSRMPVKTRANSCIIFSESEPTSTFVPWVKVTGRSVFSRRVIQGTPKIVVSSCTPPESVENDFGARHKMEKIEISQRRDESNSHAGIPRFRAVQKVIDEIIAQSPPLEFVSRYAGVPGKISGICCEISKKESRIFENVWPSSTFAGRCNVKIAYGLDPTFRGK